MNATENNAVVSSRTTAFFYLVNNRFKFAIFLFKKLPAAAYAGVKIKEADEHHSIVTVPFKWFTQNPFRSTYFACLSMAAEMSTGLLAMAHIYKRQPAVSMLIVDMKAAFHKKAIRKTYFVCEDGMAIKNAIENSINTKQAQSITAYSVGKNEAGELIAEFWFTWSFKAK